MTKDTPEDIFQTACGVVMNAKSLKSMLKHKDVVDAIAVALFEERRKHADEFVISANHQMNVAKLRRAMKPFADAAAKADDRADSMGFARSFDEYKVGWEFSFGEMRAAREAYATTINAD